MRGAPIIAALLLVGACTFSRPADVPDPTDATDGCTAHPEVCAGTDTSCVDDRCVDCPGGDDRQSSECTENGAPICGVNNDCRACEADPECASGVCESGDCVDEAAVAYVAPSGTGTLCTTDAPCPTLQQGIDTGRAFVMVAPGMYSAAGEVDVLNRTVAIRANGAFFGQTSLGRMVLHVHGGSQVAIEGGTFDGSGDGNTPVIAHEAPAALTMDRVTVRGSAAAGIASTGTLSVRRSTITMNAGIGVAVDAANQPFELTQSVVSHNLGGGVEITALRATVMNNFIVKNCDDNVCFPLHPVALMRPSDSRLEFNTIAGNAAEVSANAGAVYCGSPATTVRNSILFANSGNPSQLVFGCTVRYSIVQFATPDAANGIIADAPSFVATAADDFHLLPGSAGLGKADPAADLTGPGSVDIDGQPRPQPAATAADLGADEIP